MAASSSSGAASSSGSSSSNAPIVVEVDKQGFIDYMNPSDKKYSKKYKSLWFILIGGTMFAYKSPLNAAPLITHHLNGATIASVNDSKKKSGKKGYFTISGAEFPTPLQFACVNEDDRDNWVAELVAASSKERSEPPERIAGKKTKSTLMFRAKKSMMSKGATSGAGKGMMRRLADEDTRQLLAALKKVITKHSSEKRAQEIENHIIKIAVKCYLLIDNKNINSADFLQVDQPLRAAFELTAKIFDRVHRVTDPALLEACQRVEQLYQNCEKVLETLLLPHVKPATILRLKDVFTFLSNARFLMAIFRDDALEEDVHDLVKAMEYYTQFHYTKEDMA